MAFEYCPESGTPVVPIAWILHAVSIGSFAVISSEQRSFPFFARKDRGDRHSHMVTSQVVIAAIPRFKALIGLTKGKGGL